MKLKQDLGEIIGPENVFDDPELLEKYSKDHSFVQASRPSCVAFVENTEQVQKIVKYANEHMIPMTPRSSGVGFYGASLPSQGGIVIDLTRMNEILKIDPGNNDLGKYQGGMAPHDGEGFVYAI